MRRLRDDTGTITAFVAVFMVAVFAVIGLVVDATGQMRAVARTEHIAAEAARTGGQAIDVATELSGGPILLDPNQAIAAADAYLAEAGATSRSKVTISADRLHITVTAVFEYQPFVLGAFGVGTREITATVTADVVPQ